MTILDLNNGVCPSKDVFEDVLLKKASFEVELEFYDHIQNCPLCGDAYEGYKEMGLTPKSVENRKEFKQSKVLNLKKYFAYVASVLLLLGGIYLFNDINKGNESLAFVETQYMQYAGGGSFEKSIDTYWSINSGGDILLNDQIIDESDIESIYLEAGSKAYVSVNSDDKESSLRIINKLKNREVAVLIY